MVSRAHFSRLVRWFSVVLVGLGLLGATMTAAALPAGAQPDGEAHFDATTTIDELFSMARDAFGLGHYPLAERCYEEILLRERANLSAMLELSNVYERTGKLEYARGLLIRATRIDPNYPAIERRRASVDNLLKIALTEEADSLIARGECEQAMPKLSLRLAIEPDNASVHYKRALCLFEMGRYEAALTDAEAAITIAPQEPYFVLRDRIITQSRSSEIKQLASQAGTLAKSDNPRNREQALDLLGQILKIDPAHQWAQNEFRRLSEPDTATTLAVETGPSAMTNALRAAGSAVVTVTGFLGRHFHAVLLFLALVIVFRSPLTRALAGKLARSALLSGQLSRFSVPEVLTMMNAEPHTGVLEIRSSDCRGKVYFENGEPRHCIAGDLTGTDALMALITRARKGKFCFREGSLPVERSIDAPLSLLLVEQAHRANGVVARPGAPAEKKSRMKELLDSRL